MIFVAWIAGKLPNAAWSGGVVHAPHLETCLRKLPQNRLEFRCFKENAAAQQTRDGAVD